MINQSIPDSDISMTDQIIPNQTLPVNTESDQCEKDTIQRCPHDETNRFSIISNELIRDASISPECRWLIVYLLSNKEGWRINIQQVINHLKPHMGKNKVYCLFDEAIQSGYMKKEDRYIKNPKGGKLRAGIKYIISESPKFKKCFRLPENREAGDRDPGFREHKNILSDKKYYLEEEYITSPIPPQSSDLPKQSNGEKANAVAEESLDKSSKPKEKRAKQEFTPKVREVSNNLLNAIVAANPDYKPPSNLTSVLMSVDLMIRIDNRDPDKILDVCQWALADSFWCDKLCKSNPADYLRKEFARFSMKMNVKPEKKERKFAPSSREERTNAIAEEMERNAI